MNNLAFTWKEQSRDTEAIELMKKCVHLCSRILGVDHPDTLSASEALLGWQKQTWTFKITAAFRHSLESVCQSRKGLNAQRT